MAELNAEVRRPPGVELAVRIGIATGPVIVGDQIGEGTASETAGMASGSGPLPPVGCQSRSRR
jgi:class 3 adenylate cyclase